MSEEIEKKNDSFMALKNTHIKNSNTSDYCYIKINKWVFMQL